MLRLVSFSIDWHRSLLAHRERQHDEGGCRYSLSALLAYALYPPLYIAGPIVSFDDFVSQADKPRSPPGAVLLKLGAGLVVYLLLIEWTLNYLYVVAIKDADIFHAFTVTELGVISFFTLFVVWLKVPWYLRKASLR
jgi:D-alanyl-lipoteichoic acid acyltransferase DltB (MBOAT superfamily)